ncbi:MAG: hypothetical protein H7145_05635 [Akkermansiaceae bacterium]|nr:hypothetical protein [Armatimonadota bacterium]
MTVTKHMRGVSFAAMMLSLASLCTGCGDGDGEKTVREEVQKNTAAVSSTGTSPYGAVSTETKLPPQGKPPEPGADMSKRGPAAARPVR